MDPRIARALLYIIGERHADTQGSTIPSCRSALAEMRNEDDQDDPEIRNIIAGMEATLRLAEHQEATYNEATKAIRELYPEANPPESVLDDGVRVLGSIAAIATSKAKTGEAN